MGAQVSLYIPAFNAAEFLTRTIRAALAQTHPPAETIVVDDGSTDQTAKIASEFPIKVVPHSSNRGLAAARNTGLMHARNELVASLDADCVADRTWLERLVLHMEDPRVAMAGGRLEETEVHGLADRWRQAHMTQSWGETLCRDPAFMFGNNSLLRRSVALALGGYNEALRTNGEDADFSRRLMLAKHVTVYDPTAVVRHLRTDTLHSLVRTVWRYRVFGSQVYLHGTNATAVRRSLYGHFGEDRANLKHDLRRGKLSLSMVDALMLMTMPWLDLQFLLRQSRWPAKRSRQPKQAA